jgi:oxygen-independent coproporphyrinogen-3 oxidase
LDQALERQRLGQPVWCWFDERQRGHGNLVGSQDGQPVPPPQAADALLGSLARPVFPRRHMVYVHIPFCSKICRFCAFNRRAGQDQMYEPFAKALINQIKRYAQTPWAQNGLIDAIFFGGGTPTALPDHLLVELVEAFTRHYALTDDCEITVESRIDDVKRYDIKALVDAGVNRMSFGVQSFDTDVRRAVGRIADQSTVLKTLDHVRQMGIVNLGLDLIYNLPQQTMDTWCKDLALLATTPANSASIYALILQPGSALTQQIKQGHAPQLPGLCEEFAYFQQTDRIFNQRKNWKQFSLAHFGDPAIERCGYNSARSVSADILGLGPGAAGCIDNLAYINTHDVQGFMLDQMQNEDQHMMAIRFGDVAEKQSQWRQLTDGLNIHTDILQHAGPSVLELIEQFQDMGVIEQNQGRIHLTQEGRFWSGNLAQLINDAVLEDNPQSVKEITSHPHTHRV